MSRAEFGCCLDCLAVSRLRLQEGVAGVQHSALGKSGGATDHDVWYTPHGAGIGGDFAEAAATPDLFSHYGLKVIVLCVLIVPFA